MPRSNVQSHRQGSKSKQNVRNSHVKKYLTNITPGSHVQNTKGSKRTVYKRLKNESNRRSRVRSQSRFNFASRGLSVVNSISNKARLLSNAYNKSREQKRNAQGTKVATFLQSKFRMGKAKKHLNQLRNHQLLAAKERVRRIQKQRQMTNEDEARENAKNEHLYTARKDGLKNQLSKMNKSVKRLTRPSRVAPSLRRKPIRNAPILNLREKLNRSLANMNSSVKKIAYPNRSNHSIPKNRSKSSIEKAMNSARGFLNRKTPHWITLGRKTKHVKPIVKRVTKLAPK